MAWAAGIFDGEGCISINRQRADRRPDLRSDTFRLYIKVTMGHRGTVERMLEILKTGTLHNHIPHNRTVNASYSWLAGARQAEKALHLMQPYLITKAEELQIALEFFAIPPHWIGGSHGNTIKSPELVDRFLRCYWKLRIAKSRWRFYKRKISTKDHQEIIRLGL